MIEFTGISGAYAQFKLVHHKLKLTFIILLTITILFFFTDGLICGLFLLIFWLIMYFVLFIGGYQIDKKRNQPPERKRLFQITCDKFLIDGKERKNFDNCRIYISKKYILLEFITPLHDVCYMVKNTDFTKGNRDDLLERLDIKKNSKKFTFSKR